MPNVEFAKKAVVKVPERSAFDKSFRNLFTTKCGTLTPILCDEVIPSTTVNLKLALNCTLPPLASETFMNVNLKAEAFFVPSRLVMFGFEDFIQGNDDIKAGTTYGNATDTKLRAPVVTLTSGASDTSPYIGRGSLADYLGMRSLSIPSGESITVSAMPFLCYHLIYDSWFRNQLVQVSPFYDRTAYTKDVSWTPSKMKYTKPLEASGFGYSCTLSSPFVDGTHLGDLRQRNFGSDYFTVATPSPQKGSAQKISLQLPSSMTAFSNGGYITGDFTSENNLETLTWDEGTTQGTGAEFSLSLSNSTTDTSNPTMSFTIASLRAANSLQLWLERQNLSNNQYVSYLKANFNADLKDSIAQRPVYLGSASFPVYSKGVYQTAADSNNGNNPFDSVGSRYGHAYAEGTDFIIDHFTAEEHGYIMVLVSLVPEVTYSSGVNPYLLRYRERSSYGDCANPILQNVGPEPIKCSELDSYFYDDSDNAVFGYVDRYASWMTRNNELHGLLSDGGSLESFALQRSFAQAPSSMLQISSAFLQIPTNYMDQVTAVDSAISNYGCWIDSWLDYKVVMPLARYSVPSLQDPAYEHGQSVAVNRRGSYLD